MPSRHFKISAISKLRQIERDRARERLRELSDSHPVETNTDGNADGVRDETLEMSNPTHATPLSDRLRTVPAESVPVRPGTNRRAVVLDLNAREIAELPCDDTAGIMIIGRGHNATVRVSDPYVHRVHAHVRWDADSQAHIIAHGGGENSTYLDQKKLRSPSRLSDGARIRIGRTELVYRIT